MTSVFEKLSAINVNDKVEKKNGLTYLSWAWAWGEVKKAFPNATYNVLSDPQTSKPYFYDESLGYMVMTSVTINEETLEMWLPVMDGANKSMMAKPYKYSTRYGDKTVEAATMFDINKTIMRCLTKNLAMFGLGHYIYAGEDIPESETTTTAPTETVELETLKVGSQNWSRVESYIAANKSLGLDKIVQQLERKYKITPSLQKEIAKLIK
jgi:hypothetical protein